jgi:glucose-1-phosphate thymidylyltransferase
MKGLVLAGGRGTRLSPFTKVINKHMLPVGTGFMIEWPIWLLESAGIKDIMIVTGTEHAGTIFNYLGSKYTYRIQDKPDGIAGAIKLAEDFVGDDEFITVLGDNIISDGSTHMDVPEAVNMLGLGTSLGDSCCKVFLKSVSNPKSFGVAKFEEGNLVGVIEKPSDPPSDKAVMGLYHFGPDVFRIIKELKPSDRGELEVAHVIDRYLKDSNNNVQWVDFGGFWSDAGEMESYHKVNSIISNATPKY